MKIFKCNECDDCAPCFVIDSDKDASESIICPFLKDKPVNYIEVETRDLMELLNE